MTIGAVASVAGSALFDVIALRHKAREVNHLANSDMHLKDIRTS